MGIKICTFCQRYITAYIELQPSTFANFPASFGLLISADRYIQFGQMPKDLLACQFLLKISL